jgi:outer membrane cobalamin receptor
MVDGIPVNSSYGGTVEWNMIPFGNIERIEVIF